MKPLMRTKDGWQRCGYDICYYKNHYNRKVGSFYTLTWTINCPVENETVYFAHCYPYTYTDQISYQIENNPNVTRTLLTITPGQRRVDLLTLTDPHSTVPMDQRHGVVLSARIHPGESNASFMMQGVINFLLSNDPKAKRLLESTVFKIVPMLNPDGVVEGNYRCDLHGVDMNRYYDNRTPINQTIFSFKRMVSDFSKERNIILFCDFHGHSKEKNIFMYGCIDRTDFMRNIEIQVFPKLVSFANNFSFEHCDFNLDFLKRNTGRVVMFTEFGIMNSFTLEASFCGADQGPNANVHFTEQDLEEMGKNVMQALYIYQNDQNRVDAVRNELLNSRTITSKL